MRLVPVLVILTFSLCLTFDASSSQLTFGTNGLRMPPINLLTVYRLFKRTWNLIMNPKKDLSKDTAKGQTGAENRMGEVDDLAEVDQEKLLEEELSEDERIFLNEFKIKTNLLCYNENMDCSNSSLLDLLKSENITLQDTQKEIILKIKNANSLEDIRAEDFINGNKNATYELEQKLILPEAKTPTFLPFPFASGGWIASYIVLNSVLLGLYVFLAGPYFISGRTVERFISEEEDIEDPDQYMGYTSYGDTDMMINYMLSPDGKEEDSEEDAETKCVEDLLCRRPEYGARALSSTSLVLNMLEWIPGLDFLGSKFKKNLNRMGEALENGKGSNCEQYECPKEEEEEKRKR